MLQFVYESYLLKFVCYKYAVKIIYYRYVDIINRRNGLMFYFYIRYESGEIL